MSAGQEFDEIEAAIQRRIRDVRLSRGLSQETVADRVGVKQATISKWETKRVPPARNLWALAGALETTVSDLYAYVPGEGDPGLNREGLLALRDAIDRQLRGDAG